MPTKAQLEKLAEILREDLIPLIVGGLIGFSFSTLAFQSQVDEHNAKHHPPEQRLFFERGTNFPMFKFTGGNEFNF